MEKKNSRRGRSAKSQENLKHTLTDDERKEAAKKGGESRQKRRKFKDIFEEILTDDKQKIIAVDFVDMLMNKDIQPKTRIAIFELILRIIGEDEQKLTKNEFSALAEKIELKIE